MMTSCDCGYHCKIRVKGASMIWAIAAVFVIAGIVMILRRGEIAKGQSMMWGGTTMLGCVIIQAVFVALIGVLFLVAWQLGWLGER
jgi:hypothetical protein